MVAKCGISCLKYTLFFLNLVVWLLGICILGVAIWILSDPQLTQFADAMNFEYYYAGCYIILVAALLIILIGFLGCCGAVTENTCMIGTYFLFLILIFILEITASIYLLVVGLPSASFDSFVRNNMYKMLYNYNDDDIRWAMDSMQSTLHCCGVMSSYDYDAVGLPVPDSCRDPVSGNQYSEDCYDAFIAYIYSKSGAVAGLSLTVAFLHIALMVMSACLYFSLHKENKHLY